ncbi:ATP synthase F1 subunit epsilon [Nitratiruptor sp. SB155-2]|uniref:ATP synthase epsilon chain n=1 Tax=Nitratiruptor sp. (strain SB155-2) TaxID=387092 RepID=ATPE_NITSB|nr:ATP synthase F1 subunit epsilon [Nitratiruptor sp. SB155-2]A6Q4B9.1 RecName: Full=ATP synthase epsilon chain; AltName: Full=ATP synthase F1 sector epsilon subunit; AltName: Full=F-ATPase epsilon subunit [Nitratiruptor sp. SB155-2]BAF70328.1 F0F1-type ATP synthase, epsilon subunit [Nitratiruptor sp. SB155-2]
MDTLKLEIVTPEGLIFQGDVKSVTFPGEEGEFGVLPKHASLLSLLKPGVIEIELPDGKKESIVINWGHVNVSENQATALVEGAVPLEGTTESEIAKKIEEAKKLIESASENKAALATVEARIEKAAKIV